MAINDQGVASIRKALRQALDTSATTVDKANAICDLLDLAERATAAAVQGGPPEIVRVLRVYVFEGERKKVDEQIARSLGDGTRIVGNGMKIHVATVGSIPEIVKMDGEVAGQ